MTDTSDDIRRSVLAEAAHIVTGARHDDYGAPEDNFARIAALWSAHLDVDIDPTDVAVMMILVKIARLAAGPAHLDNWVDIAGYAACGAACTEAKP